MRNVPDSGTLLIRGAEPWLRAGFVDATLDRGLVTLAPRELAAPVAGDMTPFAGGFAGLAVDRHCRVFHPDPDAGSIEYVLWGKQTVLNVQADTPHAFQVAEVPAEGGAFGAPPAPRVRPVALACDEADYLYVADADPAAPALWLVDIWQREVARYVALPSPPRDLAYAEGRVYVLLGAGAARAWKSVGPCEASSEFALPPALDGASRLDVAASGCGEPRIFVLLAAGTANARVACIDEPTLGFDLPFCTDFLIGEHDAGFGWPFVFARRPGEDFARRDLLGRTFKPTAGLQAPGYDGRGIARMPDGRVAYWTARGLRHAAPARTRFLENGTVFGYALDSGHDQTEWGRIVLEACIPEGTRIALRCFTRDDLEYGDPIARTPPAGLGVAAIPLPETTPLPSTLAWDLRAPQAQPVARDPSRRPLAPPIADGFAHYEAPVIAPAGRYLWIVFELHGTPGKTPKLRSARVEYPRHDLVRQLPRTLWRDPHARDFLARYLMPLAATLTEWGEVADGRHRLLDPRIAPGGALPWLASFMGLAMDPCWSERARREMIGEIGALWRIRGTPRGIVRMVEILTGAKVIVVEKFRLRGGGVAGHAEGVRSRSVLGSGFRVGGSIGRDGESSAAAAGGEAFDDFAHRFSVLVVANLGEERLACLRRLIETHKPAHTMFDLCTVEAGTRVGVGLHVGLASVIGRGSAFDRLVLGDAVLGKGYLVGRPALAPREGFA
ncbi:hypothetical protein BWI17_06305 [Betaproteobacteria bacterium GR16-43]|nr:hypothetical protein BWI17_06305 [Betaproteobacteria bacterium GR16-43]